MITINVSTAARNYEIELHENFDSLAQLFEAQFSNTSYAFIITDKNVAQLYGTQVLELARASFKKAYMFTLNPGEDIKNLDTVGTIYRYLLNRLADRNALIIGLGGGVICDLAGYVAATYMRGVSYLQIPTTLLAQVDASVGGKTGINFHGGKNVIGAFNPPHAVYLNPMTCETLSEREFMNGAIEMIKYGLIMDQDFYRRLLQNSESRHDYSFMKDVIIKSIEHKKSVVEEDERDTSTREILDFGHTIGGAIEVLKKPELSHGECVALGIKAAMSISCSRGYIPTSELDSYAEMLAGLHVPSTIENIKASKIFQQVMLDKKVQSSGLKLVLLHDIGDAFYTDDISQEEVLDAMESLIAPPPEEDKMNFM